MNTLSPVPGPHHSRRSAPGKFRSPFPTAGELSLWERVAAVVPGCKDRPARAKARRYAHAPEIIAMRIGLRSDLGALGRYEKEILEAVKEPLDSPRPLAELLVQAAEEGNQGETALVHVLREESAESLRHFIREGEEAMGALSLALSQAKARLEQLPVGLG